MTETGQHTFYARTEYGAGTAAVVVKIDREAPKVTFEPNGNEVAEREVSTKVTVTDESSDVSESSLKYIWSTSEETPDEDPAAKGERQPKSAASCGNDCMVHFMWTRG